MLTNTGGSRCIVGYVQVLSVSFPLAIIKRPLMSFCYSVIKQSHESHKELHEWDPCSHCCKCMFCAYSVSLEPPTANPNINLEVLCKMLVVIIVSTISKIYFTNTHLTNNVHTLYWSVATYSTTFTQLHHWHYIPALIMLSAKQAVSSIFSCASFIF